MSAAAIITSWKKKDFKPVYWLEGDEDYFIDQIMEYAEKRILSSSEAEFNQTVFYGKDADWTDIVNACRRYPMFAERQVVLLKEAQQMKDVEKLEPYIENPLPSTILVISYKGKTLDGRLKFSKTIKKKGEVFLSKKMYESQLAGWVNDYLQSNEFQIKPKALNLLIEHIGNDLSRIVNEIDKLSINIGTEKNITEDHIEKFIGISKEYNIFELQNALSRKDAAKAIRIIQYFDANPKAAPIQLILPSLYGYFSKILSVHQMPDKSERTLKPIFSFNSYLVEQVLMAVKNYSYSETEQVILLLQDSNLKSIGIGNSGISLGSLMKELCYKIMNVGKKRA
ncbi:MAG TPA: DNA polymerase III subunit delta [Hanamia sp.]|jgi:DNA polymerase-3 subunit delta|nr:DNA polymerase III subunit delta [Hanamia sp.]